MKDFYTIVPEISKIMGNKAHRVSGMGHLGNIYIVNFLKKILKKISIFTKNQNPNYFQLKLLRTN